MDKVKATRAVEALFWLIEKETVKERRRLYIDRLLDVAPYALGDENAPASLNKDNLTAMINGLKQKRA